MDTKVENSNTTEKGKQFIVSVDSEKLLKDVANEFETIMEEEGEKLFYSAADLLNNEIKVLPCLIEPIAPRSGMGAVAGSSDLGKSTFARQLAIAVSAGDNYFCGLKILPRYRRAIYVSSEDDTTAVSYLLYKMNQFRNYPPETLRGLDFLFSLENLVETLDAKLLTQPADVVIIDAFLDVFEGKDLNAGNQVRAYLKPYSALAKKHDTLILFVHHSGKRTENNGASKNNLLGSQAFEAKMRFVIELLADSTQDDIRHVCIVKGNYLPSSYKKESISIRLENFWFSNTGDRVPLQEIKPSKAAEVLRLHKEGRTQQEIADLLGYSTRGAISKILKRNVSNVS